MDVSIIFVNYKTQDLTINAINSVISKTQGLDFEIFVVDNNSNDGSIETIEQTFPDINIIKNDINAGFGAANNLAIKQAKGKYILCLNTDTLLINNAIKIMFDFMEKEENKDVGACGGLMVNEKNEQVCVGGYFPTMQELFCRFGIKYIFKNFYNEHYGIALTADEVLKYKKEIEHINGADIFIRKSILDIVGLFDEKFFMYREETDLCYRIKKAGFDIKFVKDAQIMHFCRKSTKNLLKQKKIYRDSEIYYFKKQCLYKAFVTKIVYLILYLIDGYCFNTNESKELLKYVWSIKIAKY